MPTISASPNEQCQQCHQQEVDDWKTSDHFHAMEKATTETVLAPFDGKQIDYLQHKASFSTDADKNLWVEFTDETQKKQRLQVTYTFGYQPLQQYLFDAGNGKLQFIPFAWDSRAKNEGGQRWFVLHPDETPSDAFHWTQAGQNWNQMCADCHVTDYKKNYDPATKTYTPDFTALNVSCDACHGDSSQHLDWAKGDKTDPSKGYSINIKQQTPMFHKDESGKMVPTAPLQASQQVETCASCHARRAQLGDRNTPQDLVNAFQPALLTSDLYFPDGQIQDEVYVWGSFMQSKMHEAGVTCSNCHNPHSGKLKLPANQTCTQCHSATEYDAPEHHKHAASSANIDTKQSLGNQCVDCHMPARTYMTVDDRRDHSFKVPRPDLTLETGSPNACQSCHQDKDAQWAVDTLKTWYPNSTHQGSEHFAQVFHKAQQGQLTASTELSKIAQDANYADIVRASALDLMSQLPDANAMVAIRRAVKDGEPLKQLGAIEAASGFDISQRWSMLSPLLESDSLAVRTQAALTLAPMLSDFVTRAQLDEAQTSRLNQVLEEYRKAQAYQADRGFSHVALGNLALNLKELDKAEQHFKQAIEVEPIYVPAYVNLADVYRRQKLEKNAQEVLRQGIKIAPDNASLHYALAMSYVRDGQKPKAVGALKSATDYAPQNVNYLYTYSLLLKDQGQTDLEIEALKKAYQAAPQNPDMVYALIQALHQNGDYQSALDYALKLQQMLPPNAQLQAYIEQLRGLAGD
ncbi:MAG: tetratricopeptide repeat protein [Vibrio sp.]